MAALPKAPLWEMKAIGPGASSACGMGEAFIGRWKLRIPRQLGPIKRMRPAALATTSCCSLRPSSPTSWNPAVNTTAALADTEAASAMPAATVLHRNADQHEIDRAGKVVQRGKRSAAADLRG